MEQLTDSTVTLDGKTYTLTELDQSCWQQLAEAPEAEKNSFKTMTVATCTHNGADARITVLRKVDPKRKYVWFHTDARAEKVIQLETFPNAGLLFWDAEKQVQLRLTVETRLHTDDFVADDQWAELSPSSRKLYLSEKKPGIELPAPYPGFPEQFTNELPSESASEAGRNNFAVIECRVLNMEYLHLSRQGQTRAMFQYEPVVKLSWLAP
ncbi:pyridoxamine 5'-phosphate oxidase family protein [Spirosoma sp. KUDC1026]|uniref:pyridoxamine 5'-phosphate oxidase family protein n=1 Tax=Spirosoma sp. KUDC1026 TaxID=2745947 RepID=UPI00159BEF20|nr:pyridoxamine 5'-phosphate oxidase family protein [Spirosoma sp. KUDC1026]QKZ14041.1 pyridoxamine 5'-phosphate oxidase family protein [Spirosoma sp. KUDC1026]